MSLKKVDKSEFRLFFFSFTSWFFNYPGYIFFRLPIVDPKGNVINIMTQKPLLKFLYQFFPKLEQVVYVHEVLCNFLSTPIMDKTSWTYIGMFLEW